MAIPIPNHALEPGMHRPLRFIGQLIDESHTLSHPPSRLRARHRDLLAPDFDVRETDNAYFLEGEFPGIADREAVKLEWVDNRTLAIDARIQRVDLDVEWGLNGGGTGVPVTLPSLPALPTPPTPPIQQCACPRAQQCQGAQQQQQRLLQGPGQDGDTALPDAPSDGSSAHSGRAEIMVMDGQRCTQSPPALPFREWLAERRVGHYQRTFTFPADVDAVGVKARLGQGLLRILVPKLRTVEFKARSVPIVNCE